MHLKRLLYSASFLSIALTPLSAYADIAADFVPPATHTDSLRIDLPDSVDIITLTSLGVELNGVDITALLSLDGMDFVYIPVEPYQPGSYNLRLVTFENGETVEQAKWGFVIKGNTGESSVAGNEAVDSSQ